MHVTLKAASALLSYPSDELQAAVEEIRDAVRGERLCRRSGWNAVESLMAELQGGDLYCLQERYVELFDRSRTLSLNLFEHVHGESRDRGGAMVDLLNTYRAAGFEPSTGELPDHLPALLEFLSTQPLNEAVAVLADAAHILRALEVRLRRRQSAYSGVFELLLDIVSAQRGRLEREQRKLLDVLLAEDDDDPNDLEQLDAAWEETEVVFGPDPNAGCPAARDMLSRMAPPHPVSSNSDHATEEVNHA